MLKQNKKKTFLDFYLTHFAMREMTCVLKKCVDTQGLQIKVDLWMCVVSLCLHPMLSLASPKSTYIAR